MPQASAYPSRLISVGQFPQFHPAFSESSLRWWIFKSAENGLASSGAIVRIGRKVLIDEAKFIEWVRAQAVKAS